MAVGSCLACGSSAGASSPRGASTPRGKRLPKRLGRQETEDLSEKTKLTTKEVKALYARFRRLAPYGSLNKEQFRQTMGVLGLTDDTFLPDRMFQVFDADEDGQLSFEEFATSLAIMIRGSEDEKLKLSFEMTAGKRDASGIALEDFQSLVNACNTMMSSLIAPAGGELGPQDIEWLFHDLSADERFAAPDSGAETDAEGGEKREVITLEAYKAAAQGDEMFLQCLGLRPGGGSAPYPGRRSPARGPPRPGQQVGAARSGSRERGSPTSSQAPSQAPSQMGVPTPGQGQFVVSQAQLDDLRERVSRVNSLLQKTPGGRYIGRCSTTTSRSPSHSPPPTISEEEEDNERWWTPLPPKRAATGHHGSMSSRDSMLDEVCQELDRVLGWCSAAESGAEGAGGHPGHGLQRGASRELSREHAPGHGPLGASVSGRTTKPGQSLKRGPTNKSEFTNANSNAMATDGRTSTAVFGQKRRGKRHRLLGPKKGLAVHFGHENWNMVLSMMIGIRMAVGRSKHEIARELQDVDFYMKEKFSIIPRIANIFDSAVSKRVTVTRFIDYAPMVFQKIRASFGINHDDYIRSVGPEQLLGNMVLGNLSSLSELSSEGKSGAFFYHTADGNYMLKTVTPKEYQLLRSMLKNYYYHIHEHTNTLLVRFLGLHCLSVRKSRRGVSIAKSQSKLYFVVMANMFNTPFDIHRRYDLKGSWVGRQTPPEKQDPGVALKDVDFQQANECIRVGEERKAIIVKQIEADSAFLAAQNIIDYSLLLGIHETSGSDALATDANGELRTPGHLTTNHEDGPHSEEPSRNDDVRLPADKEPKRPSLHYPTSPTSQTTQFAEEQLPLHRRDAGGMFSEDKRSLYLFGIIDILTPYDTMKVMEHTFKGLRYEAAGVSCCPPQMYAERFNKFMHCAFGP